jgi:hypothetical protein
MPWGNIQTLQTMFVRKSDLKKKLREMGNCFVQMYSIELPNKGKVKMIILLDGLFRWK